MKNGGKVERLKKCRGNLYQNKSGKIEIVEKWREV